LIARQADDDAETRQANPDQIHFRRLRPSGPPSIHRWLNTPHVARWYEEVSGRYSAYIGGEEPVELFLILYEDRSIGEEGLLHRGLGPRIIRRFIEESVFSDESIGVCVIDPEPTNEAAIRACEKAGFRYFESVDVSEGPACLMKLTRTEFFGE